LFQLHKNPLEDRYWLSFVAVADANFVAKLALLSALIMLFMPTSRRKIEM